jgi:hypothetical protein
MASQYNIIRADCSRCPKCGCYIDLMFSDTHNRPWFYVCFPCRYVGEVGCGVVKRIVCREELCSVIDVDSPSASDPSASAPSAAVLLAKRTSITSERTVASAIATATTRLRTFLVSLRRSPSNV